MSSGDMRPLSGVRPLGGAADSGNRVRATASPRTSETRKPRMLLRLAGKLWKRSADRQRSAGEDQLPPRLTRNKPLAGPVGSSVGESA